jgi:NDP-sugar pyrophosphorylase family protein
MKAMILAAGLGTRLKPITDKIPKALVEINGRTLLEILVTKLKSYNFNEIIINLHHFPEQVIDFIKQKNNFDIHIEFSHEENLLDTGGGLKQASWFFNDNQPFLVHNVDIISNIDFDALVDHHNSNQALATLAVSRRITSRYFLFNDKMYLSGWFNEFKNEKIPVDIEVYSCKKLAFSGVQIISPGTFDLMTETGAFSLVNCYLRLSKKFKIIGFEHSPEKWFDVGKINDLEKISIATGAV